MTTAIRVLPALGLMCAALFHPAIAVADDPGARTIADGNFTTTNDPGWVFFKPQGFNGQGCGIAPDGMIGCDIVPSRSADGTPIQAGVPGPAGFYSCGGENCPLPPPGVNQIVATSQGPAVYIQSPMPTFTRNVDVLPAGTRLANGNAWCSLSEQATLQCASGAHGFTLNTAYGILD
jgi:hypothetical protein